MSIQNFSIKVADFVGSWHYPIDEDRHVNAPLPKPGKGNVVGGALAGATLGGVLGIIPSAMLNSYKPLAISAVLGAGAGLQAGINNNKSRQADLDNPDAAYNRRREQFKEHMLPRLQEAEHDYIKAIEENAYNHSNHAYGAAIQGGIGAVHAYKSVKRDDNGKVSVDPYNAVMTANMAHETYKKQQLAKEQKEEYNRRKSTPQEDLALEEQAIRERYRALHPDRRAEEYNRVVWDEEPSRLAKRAMEIREKSASILGKMTTSGKIVGAASALGATAGVGYHLGRGVQIVKQSYEKLASRAVELVNGKTVTDKAKQLVESGFKGKDFAGKKSPYINVNSRSLSSKAMAILGTGAVASGAIAAYNAHKDNKAQAEKSAGIVDRANQFLKNDKPKGLDSEKVASFLSTAAKFVTKNPTRALATAGAGVGAVSGAAAAGDGNRVQGAITGGAVGGALGAAGGKYMASKANPDIGKLKSFVPNQIAAQNMTSKV